MRRKKGRKIIFHPEVLAKNLLKVAAVLMLIWLVLSYIQVLIHSGDGLNGGGFTYPPQNFFEAVNNVGGHFIRR